MTIIIIIMTLFKEDYSVGHVQSSLRSSIKNIHIQNIHLISKIVNKQTKIMSISLKRMSDMGAKNGEDMFDVIEDDMDRYGLLTVN